MQSAHGGRAYVYKVMASNAALRIQGVPYIWYGDAPDGSPDVGDKSPNANVPLHVKVCARRCYHVSLIRTRCCLFPFSHKSAPPLQVFALGMERAMVLEAVFKDWSYVLGDAEAPVDVRRQRFSLAVGQELTHTLLKDYDPTECDESLCKAIGEASSMSGSVLSNFTIVLPDSPLATFQAVDTPGTTNPHERAHLIPKSIVNGGVGLLDALSSSFWDNAERLFSVKKDQVRDLLKRCGSSLNTDDSNFVAVTRQFHNAFDGLIGHQYNIGDGESKRRRIAMGQVMVLLTPVGATDGNMAAIDEKDRRCDTCDPLRVLRISLPLSCVWCS